jgi:hypothetical protein
VRGEKEGVERLGSLFEIGWNVEVPSPRVRGEGKGEGRAARHLSLSVDHLSRHPGSRRLSGTHWRNVGGHGPVFTLHNAACFLRGAAALLNGSRVKPGMTWVERSVAEKQVVESGGTL